MANAPWTLPTHAGLFTGRFQHELSVGWTTALDETPPTLAEQFAAREYATGGFIANLRYCTREYGLARGFATHRDSVPATILDLAGAAPESGVPGASLAPLWQGQEAPGRSPVLSELYWAPGQPDWYPVAGGNLRSIVVGSYHYIAGPNDQEQLFDIIADPFEREDLFAEPALADTVAMMRRILAKYPAAERGGR